MAILRKIGPYACSGLILLMVWWLATLSFGQALAPSPGRTFAALLVILGDIEAWKNIAATLFRGLAGLLISMAAALLLGIPAGLSKKTMGLVSPLVAALQSCPPVLWISLLMVWVGSGDAVPLGVVFASLLPPLFANVAQGVAAIDQRLLDMARVYELGRWRTLLKIVLPGLYPFLLASLSFVVGICWKVTAVAEFFGAPDGIGSRIYWSYRMLEMPQMFAWALILVLLGLALEVWIIQPLRHNAEQRNGKRS